jgi:tetratricopeptide (TPR) repeat protein
LRNDKTKEEFLLISYIGCLYEARGYLDKAKEYFDSAIAIKKDDILPLYRLGEVAFKLEDNDEAEHCYKKVLELDSFHEQAMLDLASIAKRREDRELELDYLLRAFNLNPFCIPVETVLQVMEKQSEIEEFKVHLLSLEKKVEQAFLYDALAHVHGKLGDLNEEEKNLNKAFELEPTQMQILVHQVKLWMRQGKVKQAKAKLHTLIIENSEIESLYDTWIELMTSTRSMPKLDGEIRKMKLSNQEKSMVFLNAAAAYERHLQSMQDAVEEVEEQKSWLKRITNFSKVSLNFGILIGLYEESIKLDRENRAAVFWFADFYENSGLSEDAIKVLEQSLRHNWDSDIAYRLAGQYVNEYGTVSEKKAVKYLSEACNLLETLLEENEDPDYFNLLGVALTELGEYVAAENALMHAVEIEPAVEKGYFHLSRIYEAMENYKKAEKAIANAVDIDPNDPENYNQLGLIYKHQNKMEQALEAVEKAISIEPEDLISLYNRVCYLSILGRFKESADQLEILYKLDEELIFTEMAEDDEDLDHLKEAGYFPLNPLQKR